MITNLGAEYMKNCRDAKSATKYSFALEYLRALQASLFPCISPVPASLEALHFSPFVNGVKKKNPFFPSYL
ncbi:MAG: hypothetical protein C0628_05665 [Sulfurimonas sp.]|nr:MAG: hypothetical protein C0628_05665 [Sulfurimonas sp.]